MTEVYSLTEAAEGAVFTKRFYRRDRNGRAYLVTKVMRNSQVVDFSEDGDAGRIAKVAATYGFDFGAA